MYPNCTPGFSRSLRTVGLTVVVIALSLGLGACTTLLAVPELPASLPQAGQGGQGAQSAPPAQRIESAPSAQAAWSRVLARFVNERGEVGFQALATQRLDLDRYVRYVAQTPLASLPEGPERLAHMINAYNALSMFNVLESGVPATHAGLAKVRFFLLRKMVVGGEAMSLYHLENNVIRPYTRSINDPRVHFALNCSARACPVLPRVPFTAEALDAELERDTKAFFARAENFRVDTAQRTVWLSELLNFYPEDFVPQPAPSLLAYANRYAPQPAPLDYTVRFTPYDWTVANSSAPR